MPLVLQSRLAELQAIDPAPPALSTFLRAMPLLPLFHRLGEPLRGPHLILEVAAHKAGREAIGTDGCIFASIGVAAYLTPPLVLAFGPMRDAREGRRSAPWDSRGLRAVLGCDAATHARHITERSIAAPDDEPYLAHYLARGFDDLYTWLGGQRPTGSDVLGVFDALRRQGDHEDLVPMTTPEARYEVGLDLSSLLLAAFVDADYPVGRPDERGWAETFGALEVLLGDDFHRLRRGAGAPDLRGAAYRFVRGHLEREGLR